jgi:hypothetical protein
VFLKPVIWTELCFYKNTKPLGSILFCGRIAAKVKVSPTQPIYVFIKTQHSMTG